MDSLGLTAILAAILGAPVGALVQWMATKNKTAGEAQAAIAGGARDVVEASSIMLDKMQESIDSMKEEFEFKIDAMQKEIDILKKKLQAQQNENIKLQEELDSARQTIHSLSELLEKD